MKFSILIPAFNEAKILPETLSHLKEVLRVFGELGHTYEVILCDNNSNDDTARIATSFGARVVFEPINQISRARNRASSVASGDWFIFLDADSSPSVELLKEVIKVVESGHWMGGGTTIVLDHATHVSQLIVHLWNFVSRLNAWVAGSFVFIEAQAFRELKGFGESYFAGEELDLSRRAKALARSRGLKWGILHSSPLLTSGRKARLYSVREMTSIIWKWIIQGDRAFSRKENCDLWYDGKR